MVVKHHEQAAGSEPHNGFKIFIGRIVHSKSLKHLEILPHAALGIKPDGTIAFLDERGHSPDDLRELYQAEGFENAVVASLKRSSFLFPGMIDTHLHAPQWPNLALGMEGALREWCVNWTDPIEVSLRDSNSEMYC